MSEQKDENTLSSPIALTPMVRQYQEIKSRHRDKILLFRVGDFYEMFYEDAKEAAGILQITLTSRGDMPMAGFPFHAADHYIHKLIGAGKKVAVCEQLEDPSKAKGLVKRDIVSVITPGTILDDSYIAGKQNNYLCSIFGDRASLAVSFVDISTGDFYVLSSLWFSDPIDQQRVLQDELARFHPSEIIYNERLSDNKTILFELNQSNVLMDHYPEWYFDDEFFISQDKRGSSWFPEEIVKDRILYKSVMGAFHYLYETQGVGAPDFIKKIDSLLSNIRIINKNTFIEMDDFTIKNLELVRNMQDGGRKYTLLEALDLTVTSMGGRLLRHWISMPLFDIKKIYERQNFIETFFEDSILTSKAREVLKRIGDIDRLTARITLKKAIPRDLVALSSSLKNSLELKNLTASNSDLTPLSGELAGKAEEMKNISELIDKAICDEPSTVFNGEVIKAGFNGELDSLRLLLKEGKNWILKLQNDEREKTGISSLKIKYNNIFGYFIEISKANLDNVPAHYIRKQSLVNAERYTVPELSEYESQIASANEKNARLEEEIFISIIEETSKYTGSLQTVAGIVALIDVYSSLAVVAKENKYVKPSVDIEEDFQVTDGRHPVVEKYMGQNLFVSNDVNMDNDDNRILIITGPNMAGKSTYLRQNALIAIMAQMGSYVPARKAKIGMVDKIFTRIGASDNLSQGQSTFLVEMQEAANILRNSTSRSLIIMDELGRGTSTFDGLSIAWSVIEYLYEHKEKGGKTLFATHYHELTKLGEKKGIQNYNIAVREYKDDLVFLRKVIAGPADRSYGIYVAKLAGINQEIIDRAKIILETLEAEGNSARNRIENIFDSENKGNRIPVKRSSELELFPDNLYQSIADKIKNIDVNSITPLEAITFLAEIKKQLK